jgi:DNA-binding MltR family transcriptional regulator
MADAKIKTRQQFDDFAEDLLAERSERPLIIIGAAKIEQLLFEILSTFLLPKRVKAKEQDELLEGDTPLGTFSARIKICHRLGLIDEKLFATLDLLRRIRNLCAHSVSFDHAKSPVREHLAEFKRNVDGRSSYQLTRQRYFDNANLQRIEELQCLLLTVCVLLEAIQQSLKRTSGHKKALGISVR